MVTEWQIRNRMEALERRQQELLKMLDEQKTRIEQKRARLRELEAMINLMRTNPAQALAELQARYGRPVTYDELVRARERLLEEIGAEMAARIFGPITRELQRIQLELIRLARLRGLGRQY